MTLRRNKVEDEQTEFKLYDFEDYRTKSGQRQLATPTNSNKSAEKLRSPSQSAPNWWVEVDGAVPNIQQVVRTWQCFLDTGTLNSSNIGLISPIVELLQSLPADLRWAGLDHFCKTVDDLQPPPTSKGNARLLSNLVSVGMDRLPSLKNIFRI